MAIAQHPSVVMTLGGLLDRLVENGDASVEISVPLARGKLLFVPDDDPLQQVVEEIRDETPKPDGQSVTIREAAKRLGIEQQTLYDAVARDRTRNIHTPFKRATATRGEPFTAPWHEVEPWLVDHRTRHPKANLSA